MGRAVRLTLATFVFLSLWSCSSEPLPTEVSQNVQQPMSGGQVDNGDLAVGLLFSHGDGGTHVNESCSGSLIAPTVVLTAGHCFDTNIMDAFYVGQGVAIQGGDTDWEKATVNMRRIRIDQWARPPQYKMNTGCPPTVLDVAVAHLAEAVTDVAPLPLGTAAPPPGAMVTTIGFGRHPTSVGPDPTCIQGCNGDCNCQQTKCGCKNLQPVFGNFCICNDMGAYDQMVKRTATVTVAEALATTLHQTMVTDSVDLPGDSGGPVLYNGAIVATDSCGNGAANAQTDQHFARVDLAHDWIVGKLKDYGVDGGVVGTGTGGTGGSTGAGGGRDSGAEGSGGAAGTGGSGTGVDASGGASGTTTSTTGSTGAVTTGTGSGGTSGTTSTGSTATTTGSATSGAGGAGNSGGASGSGAPAADTAGCSCRTPRGRADSWSAASLSLLAYVLLRRRRSADDVKGTGKRSRIAPVRCSSR